MGRGCEIKPNFRSTGQNRTTPARKEGEKKKQRPEKRNAVLERTDGAMIRSKMSCEVAADAKQKELPEAGAPPSPSSSAETSSAMAPAPRCGLAASARETSAADALQDLDRNSSGSRAGRSERSVPGPSAPFIGAGCGAATVTGPVAPVRKQRALRSGRAARVWARKTGGKEAEWVPWGDFIGEGDSVGPADG
jgi:hypothetical protein